ncbi:MULTISPECIES: DUF3237 domain-containing protein [unclassified Paraburkholderia]|uniref:DUF3237 domain-containing protein n=1 Tax=unclassified Paraburkholderia TaxID=2615204 RepID=UPI002AB2239C|nr:MULTISPECIES: DUF3237 domain-containing protein [unclassified Paraburkholderia]
MTAGRTLQSEWCMRIDVQCGEPQMLGRTPGGQRINFPIVSGRFEGASMSGVVLPSGSDFYLERADGVGVLDARYTLQTREGTLINVCNRGLLVIERSAGPGVWPLPPEAYRCRCTPVFDAPDGECDWLNRSVFAGTIGYPAVGEVVVDVWRLT